MEHLYNVKKLGGQFLKFIFLAFIFHVSFQYSAGQVTIAQQDFETSPAAPVWTYSNTGGATSATNTGTPASQRIRTGTRSFQINNASGVLTFGDVNVSGYNSVKVIIRISSISVNATNGADAADYLRAFVKLNAAAFLTNSQANADIAVNGNSNARWGYNTTGATTNAGTNLVVAGTSGTNQGTIYSTLTINIPNGTSTVGLRINSLNDDANEVWCIDDVIVEGINPSINYYWNGSTTTGNGPVAGGSGTWNTATNWISPTNNAAGTPVAWVNSATNSIANFPTGPGTVDLATDITAAGINVAANYIYSSSATRTITSPIDITAAGSLSLSGLGSGSITIPGIISGSGNVGFNSTGTGFVTLNGNNTHTGTKNIIGGLLNLGHANALGASGTLNINGGTLDNSSGAAITTPNYPQTWNGNFAFTGTNPLNLGTGAVNLAAGTQVTVNASTLTVGGVISGSPILTKAGAGNLLLTGTNTYNGGTMISGGTLTLGSATTLGNSTPVILNGGTLKTGTTTGFSETMGTLELLENSTIALGTGNHTIVFANSSGVSWTPAKTLTITGWTGTVGTAGNPNGKIIVGTGGLTTGQLAQVTFAGFNPGAIIVSGELVPAPVAIDFVNLQFPGTANITVSNSVNVYAQAYEPGVTEAAGPGTGITAWIGVNTANTDPSTWGSTVWTSAAFNIQAGNNDEFTTAIGATLAPGTYYYASRFLITGGLYQYGGFNGGEWNGTSNINGVLTVNDNTVDFCNIQNPATGSILRGGGFNVYSQVYEPGMTEAAGANTNIAAWIGYSTTNSNPNSGSWTWVSAPYNLQAGNNDEYVLNLGATLAAVGPGTYYYASRYRIGAGSYQYGGTGGVWSNNSGVLNVADVKGNGNTIAYQGSTTSAANNTDFGSACIGTPVVKTFTISNASTTNTLSFGAVTITGAQAADFAVTTAPSSPVAASGSTTFQVTFSAGATGARNAVINVATDAATYFFSVTGTGQIAPNINTQPSSTTVASPTAATFTINASNSTGYQWQWYNGTVWVDLTNVAPYSGVTSTTLTISPTNVSYNDYEFRCVVKASTPCGDIISNSAILTVTQGPCLTEGFESGLSGSYSTGTFNLSSGSWVGTRVLGGTPARSGARACQFEGSTGSQITSPVLSNIGTIKFWARGSTASGAMQVNYRINGGAWIPAPESPYSLSTTYTQYTATINNASNNIEFQFYRTGAVVYVDDVEVNCLPVACTPTATITSFLPTSGPTATIVTITGTGFTGATAVKFGGLSAASFTVVNSTTITAEVPSGAGTGKVSVTVGTCDAVSGSDFTVISQSGTCAVLGGGSIVSDISISEVYDAASGSLSYIEIFNGTGSTVTLGAPNNYVLRVRTGASTDVDYPLTGTIASGATYIVRLGTGTICSGVTPNLDEPTAGGFNGNDRIYLRKNGTDIDYVPNPNYGGTEKPGFSQYRKAATTAPTIPSTTYTASDWIITTTENCTNLSTAPYSLTGSGINITAHPVDVSCSAITFSITATGSGAGSNAYVWKYYNPVSNAWENASGITNAAMGVTASGTNTATMSITGNTAHLQNYQFYCEVQRGSCIAYSNAAQYSYATKLVYRSKVTTGNWSAAGSWEMTDDAVNGPWITTCAYPNSVNCQSVVIATGNAITLDLDNKVNSLTINSNATLINLANAELSILNGNTSGADFTVSGTLVDEANSANSIIFEGGATWTLGTAATIIKSNTSFGSRYRDHYETGIANIPATANWIYRYNNPAVTVLDFVSSSAGSVMYYPNLTLENTISGNTHSSVFNSFTPQFSDFAITGVTNPLHIKGNFDVGGAGPGFINFLNINSIAPVFVEGNTIIRAGNTLRNNGDATNNGAGFDLKGNLTVDGTFINNGGAANTGVLRFSGILPQSVGGAGTIDLENVDIANTAAGIVNVNRNLSVPGVLSLGSALAKLNVNTGIITLKSSPARTAQVGSIPTGALITYGTTGRFEVERYLPPLRAWRFLSTPVAAIGSPTITEAWREGGLLTSTGYGTQITGPEGAANGFDAVTTGYSMKWYDASISNYKMVTNTSGSIANDAGYMVFVRGDRSIGVGGTTSATNLRIKGQIRTGLQVFPTPANSFQSIGNPYPSRISFPDLLTGNPLIGSYYIAWDPSLNGSYAVGGFQTLSSLDGYQAQAPAPGAGTSSLYIVNNTYPDIESGQAFYIQNPTAAPLPVTIDENMKTTGSRIASREPTMEDRQFIRTRLYTNTGEIADGNMVAFDDELNNDFESDDAIKFTNSGENFGMSRFGKKLSVEGRNRIQPNDTIHYNMSNLREQEYKISILPEKLSGLGMEAYFVDRFLNTQTPVSLATNTDIAINITSNAASKAANRFYLVFKSLAGPLPVTFVSVAAQRQADRSIAVKWKVANEINIDHYEVERSANGTQFNSILTNDAQGTADYSKNDLSPLAADNFYRIKATGIAGDITYSAIVKVSPLKSTASISVYPNPVVNGQLGIQFTGQAEGNYTIQLVNAKGQLVYKGTVYVASDNTNETIRLNKTLAKGTYQLSVQDIAGKITNHQVLVQ